MSDDIVKKPPNVIDNFAGWDDGIEGDDRPQGAGIIQGTLVKFTNEAMWVTRDGDELPPDLELIAVDVGRVVQRWQDAQPVETIILEPHQLFPDIEEMNEKVPRKEWVEGPDGQPRGPWQAQHVSLPARPEDHGQVHISDRHHRRQNWYSRVARQVDVDATATRTKRLSGGHTRRQVHEHEIWRATAAAFRDRALGATWWRGRRSRSIATAGGGAAGATTGAAGFAAGRRRAGRRDTGLR